MRVSGGTGAHEKAGVGPGGSIGELASFRMLVGVGLHWYGLGSCWIGKERLPGDAYW